MEYTSQWTLEDFLNFRATKSQNYENHLSTTFGTCWTFWLLAVPHPQALMPLGCWDHSSPCVPPLPQLREGKKKSGSNLPHSSTFPTLISGKNGHAITLPYVNIKNKIFFKINGIKKKIFFALVSARPTNPALWFNC